MRTLLTTLLLALAGGVAAGTLPHSEDSHAGRIDIVSVMPAFWRVMRDLDPLTRKQVDAGIRELRARFGELGDMTIYLAPSLFTSNGQVDLLSPASYSAMFERRVDTKWPGVAMGLGWQLGKQGEAWLPRHPGSEAGFKSLLTLYPEQRRAIVILSNGEGTPRWEIRELIENILALR